MTERPARRPGDRGTSGWRCRPASSGARPRRRTRSRARPPRTAADRPSGTPSATRPGGCVGGETGDVAVDHYHRYREDVALMAELGLTAYRFSVSWPRVQPAGRGPGRTRRGLDFYRRLVDELLGSGHRAVADALPLGPAAGAGGRRRLAGPGHRRALRRLRRRSCTTRSATGCATGPRSTSRGARRSSATPRASTRPAGRSRRPRSGPAHHLLLGHGLAVQAMLRPAARDAGSALSAQPLRRRAAPAPRPTPTPPGASTGCRTGSSSTRCCAARYPADVVADLAPVTDFGHVRDGDLAIIAPPLDVLGINYYSRHVVRGRRRAAGRRPRPARRPLRSPCPGSEDGRVRRRAGRPVTAMGWEIDAGRADRGAHPGQHRSTPPPPLYVTENGAAFDDTVTADGRVHDRERTAYLAAHLRACRDAIAAGVAAARLLRLVAAGQLRVGLGLRHALRARARRLRDPAPACSRTARSGTPTAPAATPRPLPDAPDGRDRPPGLRSTMMEPRPEPTGRALDDLRRYGWPQPQPVPARPTLEAVAALAGVSRGTVSRVINDSPQVSPRAREAVQQAIDELGFVPEPGRPDAGHPADRLGGAGRLGVGGAVLRRAVLRRDRARDLRRAGRQRRCSCCSRWPSRRPSGNSWRTT